MTVRPIRHGVFQQLCNPTFRAAISGAVAGKQDRELDEASLALAGPAGSGHCAASITRHVSRSSRCARVNNSSTISSTRERGWLVGKMRVVLLVCALCLLHVCEAALSASGRTLVWSDEFSAMHSTAACGA